MKMIISMRSDYAKWLFARAYDVKDGIRAKWWNLPLTRIRSITPEFFEVTSADS